MAPPQVGQPPHPGPGVLHEGVPGGVGPGVRAGAHGVVVVHLEVADAVADHAVHDGVEVVPCGGVAHVQAQAALFHEELAVAAHEGLLGEASGQGAAHPDGEGLDPQARHHALSPDEVQGGPQAVGEAPGGGLPGADGVPPGPVLLVGVPAVVDAVDLRASPGGGGHQGGQALLRGVGHEGVHVVVEDDGRGRGGRCRALTQGPAVGGEPGDGALPAGVGQDEGGGGGDDLLAGAEGTHPAVLAAGQGPGGGWQAPGRAGPRQVPPGPTTPRTSALGRTPLGPPAPERGPPR